MAARPPLSRARQTDEHQPAKDLHGSSQGLSQALSATPARLRQNRVEQIRSGGTRACCLSDPKAIPNGRIDDQCGYCSQRDGDAIARQQTVD